MKHAYTDDKPDPGNLFSEEGVPEDSQDESLIHEVVKGDTVRKISNFYGVNYDELIRVNSIKDPNVLLIGQLLLIPK